MSRSRWTPIWREVTRRSNNILTFALPDQLTCHLSPNISAHLDKLRSCVKEEVDILDSLSLIVCAVSVDVKQHWTKWKVEWEALTGMCRWSISTFKTSCGCTALDMPAWRKTAEQTEQVACFSEDLKCWEAWDTTCGHRAEDITPLITWRREACKEEALDDLPWKDERGPSSVGRTLEPFQRLRWGNFWQTGWSTYGLFKAHRCHLEMNWNWTELNCTKRSKPHNVCSNSRFQLHWFEALCHCFRKQLGHVLCLHYNGTSDSPPA